MATRDIVSYGNSYSDGTSSNSYVTGARQTRFVTLGILGPSNKVYNMGGVQTLNFTQSNGARWEAQSGDDFLEIIFGMRSWAGQFARRAERGADFEEMVMRIYPDMTDFDPRDVPFILSTRYRYQNYNGSKLYEASEWRLRKVFVTDYRLDAIPGPTDVMRETVTIIAAGHSRTFGNGKKIGSPDAVVGATYFSVPSTKSISTVKPNPAALATALGQAALGVGSNLAGGIGTELGSAASGVGL
ncbi:MAG: hypothetical protein KGL39_37970 [Patescibacteria group bacterium]|nr:hypothetical protein [Patescibacteria group bacterium]